LTLLTPISLALKIIHDDTFITRTDTVTAKHTQRHQLQSLQCFISIQTHTENSPINTRTLTSDRPHPRASIRDYLRTGNCTGLMTRPAM